MGYGILELVEGDSKQMFNCIGLFLRTKVFNRRLASDDDVKKLWKSTNQGQTLQQITVEHAVIVGVEDPRYLADDWSKKWNAPVK